NAWNTGSDWFFTNVNYTGNPRFTWRTFLERQKQRGWPVAMTVSLLGHVAKDTRSYGFPVSTFGPQQQTAPENPDAGNGKKPNGDILVGNALQTSVPFTPDDTHEWVTQMEKWQGDVPKNKRVISHYILDNEPMLWHL